MTQPRKYQANQDGVRVETRRARAPADPAAAQGVPVPGHHHPEDRATKTGTTQSISRF